MGRKSSVDRLPTEVKAHLNRRLREGRLTLDELIADLRAAFPQHAGADVLPSRSALHRHSQSVRQIVAHEREMQVAAEALPAPTAKPHASTSAWADVWVVVIVRLKA